jgi:aryl sulfotransferase
MPEAGIVWPRKTRELHNHHMDSTRWNGFSFRDGDVVIATYGKAGTTWTQQIVSQLLFSGEEGLPIHDLSPWLDLRVMPREETLASLEAQTHRRFIKTHLPVDALVFSPKARYLYVARDGRDVVWSFHHHHAIANDLWYDALNNTPGLVGPPIERPNSDIRQYFRDWLDKDGFPFWPFWENIRSWWQIRNLPNVRLLHFSALKKDLAGEIRAIARFLDIAIDESRFPTILEHCGFDYMKRNAAHIAPGGGIAFEGGGQAFLPSGTNGRWRDVLSREESLRYERMAVKELGLECAHWLATGELPR